MAVKLCQSRLGLGVKPSEAFYEVVATKIKDGRQNWEHLLSECISASADSFLHDYRFDMLLSCVCIMCGQVSDVILMKKLLVIISKPRGSTDMNHLPI